MMYSISLKNISKSFGSKEVLKDFSLNFDNSKINCLIGESGKGKSTILNIISGLLPYDSGSIEGCDLNSVSYIFQEDRLLSWLTVEENIKLSLSNYYKDKELNKKTIEVLKMVGGEEWLKSYPDKLSGGQKQRINIARALGKPSKVILMDEPFKSLDYKTKYLIMDEVKEILKKDKRIVIFVTHDVDECIYFKGKVIIVGGSPLKIKGIFTDELKNKKEEIINLL